MLCECWGGEGAAGLYGSLITDSPRNNNLEALAREESQQRGAPQNNPVFILHPGVRDADIRWEMVCKIQRLYALNEPHEVV